jgi:two-component system phosphate regulon sensor histidine kinase PhoR
MASTTEDGAQRTADRSQVTWQRQFHKFLYLFTAFPLGLVYFVFLITGMSLGLATLVIWIGVGVLVLTMLAWWQLAKWERWLALHWLNAAVPPLAAMPYPLSRASFIARVRNPMTWKTLTFLLLKFPCGLLYFGSTLLLLLVSLIAAILSLAVGALLTPFVTLGLLIANTDDPTQRLRHFLLFAATGFGVGVVAFALIEQMVRLASYLATTLLGMSDADRHRQSLMMQIARERAHAAAADQRRRQLIVDMSHELRTPVASIAAHLESLLLLTDDGALSPPPSTIFAYLTIANQEVSRLSALVDELLSLARMESDELRLDIQVVEAREVIETVYQALAPLAERERHITLVRGADPHLPPVLADHQRLIQILTNLVRNAIAYTSSGGLVSLSLERAGDEQLALVVADNGIGIPQDDLDRIFERFYRVDSSRARATGGFGLGLAIVHSLVAAMGGSLTVESTEGEGSRFIVFLRVAPDAIPPTTRRGVAG